MNRLLPAALVMSQIASPIRVRADMPEILHRMPQVNCRRGIYVIDATPQSNQIHAHA